MGNLMVGRHLVIRRTQMTSPEAGAWLSTGRLTW
jgi:hypothetical protein